MGTGMNEASGPSIRAPGIGRYNERSEWIWGKGTSIHGFQGGGQIKERVDWGKGMFYENSGKLRLKKEDWE